MACAAETEHSQNGLRDTSSVTDLGELIARDTDHRYPYAGRRLLLTQPNGVKRIACGDLLEGQCFHEIISRFASTYPPETDRRALVSFWSLYYVSALMIDPILCWLELRRILPLAIDEIDLLVDSETGLPSSFLLASAGDVRPDITIHQAMSGVIRHHLEPLIAVIAKQCGLSKRLLWTNAAAYLRWMVHEVGRLGSAALKAEGMVLLDAPTWPDNWKNPFHNLVRVESTDSGEYVSHRRICCMRYAVPGVAGCGTSCPVAEGRNCA